MSNPWPCPFCGDTEPTMVDDHDDAGSWSFFACDCGAEGPRGCARTTKEAREIAYRLWNQRVTHMFNNERVR